MVSACDGARTVRELFAYLKSQQVLSPEITEAAFLPELIEMIARGFVNDATKSATDSDGTKVPSSPC